GRQRHQPLGALERGLGLRHPALHVAVKSGRRRADARCMGLRVFPVALLFGLIVDLGTKVVAVGLDRGDGWLLYNGKPSALLHRVAMSLVALAATVVLARLARWRGMGEIWGACVGCGLLVAGIMGNGLS